MSFLSSTHTDQRDSSESRCGECHGVLVIMSGWKEVGIAQVGALCIHSYFNRSLGTIDCFKQYIKLWPWHIVHALISSLVAACRVEGLAVGVQYKRGLWHVPIQVKKRGTRLVCIIKSIKGL